MRIADCGLEDALSVRNLVYGNEVDMSENKSLTLPKFTSLDGLVDFLDTHDLGDYLDQLPEAHFDVTLPKTTQLILVDEEMERPYAKKSI